MLIHLLGQRGYSTADEIADFFDGRPPEHDPMALPDMRSAVARIRQAADMGQKVAVFGDFDCDGLTASAVLHGVLRELGLHPRVVIPTRQQGHGLSLQHIEALASSGVDLIITADCGIGDIGQVDAARGLGTDVIVTDHHQPNPDGSLPACLVVSPSRLDSEYPWPSLSGAGVAYKLAQALLENPARYEEYLDLVALGTVADVVALRDENRTLVSKGLRRLQETQRCGLRALFGVAGVDSRRIDSASVGFYLGPRINAANRLADPQTALDLILATDPAQAHHIAQELNTRNGERQAIVDRELPLLLEQIGPPPEVALEIRDGRRPPIICVAGDWPPGVSGLLANGLADAYSVPALAASAREPGVMAASGRSVRDVNILELLHVVDRAVPGAFLGFGGHSLACGFTARLETLDEIYRCLETAAKERVPVGDLGARLTIDARIKLSQVDMRSLELVEKLGPYGRDFSEPAFLARGIYVQRRQRLGGNGKHLKAIACSGTTKIPAMLFACDPELAEYSEDLPIDAVFNLQRDDWNGASRPMISIRDWRPYDG